MQELRERTVPRLAVVPGAFVVTAIQGDRSIIEALAAEWRALCAEGPCDDPRLTPEWILSYLITNDARARVTLIVVRDGGRLRGVLPLVRHRFGIGPFAIRWFRSASNMHSTRFALIHGKGDRERVVEAIWSFLQEWQAWDVLHLRSVAADDALSQLIQRADVAGYATEVHGESLAWIMPVPDGDATVDELIGALTKRMRQQLRAAARKLDAHGEVRLVRIDRDSPPARQQEALAEFYALEAAGWKGRAGTAIACDPDTRAFYDRIARDGFQRGYFSLHRLECNGELIASAFGITIRQTYLGLKTTYDETYAKMSPGHLLTLHLLTDLATQGIQQLNMGSSPMGTDEYKRAWSARAKPFSTRFVFRPSVRGRVAAWVGFTLIPMAQRQGLRGRRWARRSFVRADPGAAPS